MFIFSISDKDRSVGYFSCFSSDIDTPSSATVMSTFCENREKKKTFHYADNI